VETITANLADGVSAQALLTAVASKLVWQFANLPLEVEPGQAVQWPLTLTAVNNGSPDANAAFIWAVKQSNGTTLASGTGTTSSTGTATFIAPIPALATGASITVRACLASTCVSLPVTVVSPGAPVAIPWSGTSQTIAANTAFAPLVLEITDGAMPGNPLAGVTVAFTESFYSYEPAGADGKQPPPRLLAQTSQSAISDVNGLASIQPLQPAGVAGTVVLTAGLGSRTVGTWTLLAEPTVAPTQGGPVALRKFSPRR
jgi:hypothetical protein